MTSVLFYILRNLGYPQPPTPLFCDNECTIGLANDALRKKQPKSMDLRWDWLRDRVAQRMFILPYLRSLLNSADFFTKALPRAFSPFRFLPYTLTASHLHIASQGL